MQVDSGLESGGPHGSWLRVWAVYLWLALGRIVLGPLFGVSGDEIGLGG